MIREELKNEFLRLRRLNIPKHPRCAVQMDDAIDLAEILSDEDLQNKIDKMRKDYMGTRLEKYL